MPPGAKARVVKAQRSNDARRGGRPRGVAARACRTAIARSRRARGGARAATALEKRRSLEISREPRKPPGCLLVGRSTHQEAGVGHAGGGDALVVRSVRGGGGHNRGSLRLASVRRGEGDASVGVGCENVAEGRATSQSAKGGWIEDVGGAVSSLSHAWRSRARGRG